MTKNQTRDFNMTRLCYLIYSMLFRYINKPVALLALFIKRVKEESIIGEVLPGKI